MTDASVWASASGHLLHAWAERWLLIFVVGSALPICVRLLRPHWCSTVPFVWLRRCCAVGALVLIASSIPMALDTWRVESADAEAIERFTCLMGPKQGEGWLDCRDQGLYRLAPTAKQQLQAAPGTTTWCSAALPFTKVIVAMQACPTPP